MMVDDVLVPLGDSPLNSSPYSFVLVAMINSYLTKADIEEVTGDTAANDALGRIWSLPEDRRRSILRETVSGVRDRNGYRVTLTSIAVLVGIIVVPVMIVEVLSAGTDHSGMGFNFLINLADIVSTYLSNTDSE